LTGNSVLVKRFPFRYRD